MLDVTNKKALAYITGVALGDGNLSNPNKRAVRLRITCSTDYPENIETIKINLQKIAPNNKISIIKGRGNYIDISCYSNSWPQVLEWNVGDKIKQNVRIPKWIKDSKECSIECLRGLLQTDGSMYFDRGYQMVNFVNHCENLARDTLLIIENLGFSAKMSIIDPAYGGRKFTIRIAKNVANFIETIGLKKQ